MKSKLIVLSVCLGILAVSLHAGSSDPTVVHGTATFDREGGNWTITTSHQTIINWQSFGVDAGTIMRFVQPGRNSLAVNRVTGLTPSLINGTLTANGRLMLINPNGIMVGPNGVVSASSFIASTLDASNQDLLNGGGINFFGHSTASIENLGTIKALNGDVTLISHNIINNGQLFAPNGSVNLAAGSDVLLTADGELFINGGGLGIANTDGALIDAAQAQLKAHHDNVYALAINNEGIIRATGTAELADGRVILQGTGGAGVTNTGEIVAVDYDGTGGYVDTSSESGLSIRGSVQTGVGGEWLIDPTDLWVVQTANGTYSHEVEAGWVSDQLNRGGNVRLVTRDPGASGGGEEGDIHVAATIEKTSGGDASLILRAHDDILMHGGVGIVNSSADGVLNLRAIAGYTGNNGAQFTMQQTAGNGSYVDIDGAMYVSHSGRADLRDITAGTLRVVGGNVQFRGPVQTAGNQIYEGGQAWAAGGSLHAGGSVVFNGAVDGANWGGPRDFTIEAANSIRFYGNIDPNDAQGRSLNNVTLNTPTVWLDGRVVNAPTSLDSSAVGTVRVLSPNASIQQGVDIVSAGGLVRVGAGNYSENVNIYKPLDLVGGGSGSDASVDTIITAADPNSPVMSVSASGTAADRMVLRNFRVTGATRSGNPGSGILFPYAGSGGSYTVLRNITSTSNSIGVNVDTYNGNGVVTDLRIIDSNLSGNSDRGLNTNSYVHVDGLTLRDTVADGGQYGLYVEGNSDNVRVIGGSYSNNGDAGIYFANTHLHDSIVIDGATVNGNKRGIIANMHDRLVIKNSTVSNNTNEGITVATTGDIASPVIFDNVTAENNSLWNLWLIVRGPHTVDDVRVLNSTFTGSTNSSYGYGVWLSPFNGATLVDATIDNNIIAGNNYGLSVNPWTGGTLPNAVATNNTVTGNGVGLEFWRGDGSASNNTLTGNTTGVYVTRGSTVSLTDNSISGSGMGVEIDTGDLTMTGNDFSGATSNVTDVKLAGGSVVFGDGQTFDASQYYIENLTGTDYDLTGLTTTTYGGVVGPTATLAESLAIEEKMYHAMDDPASGLLTWQAGSLFVTPGSLGIQHAIDIASVGDTVYVAPGTFAENLNINKPISLIGDGSTNTTELDGTGLGGTGMAITAGGTDASNRLLIDGFYIHGYHTGITADFVGGYVTLNDIRVEDTTYGMWMGAGATTPNLTDFLVTNSQFNNNTQNGVLINAGAQINDLVFDNVAFSGNGVGMGIGGAGTNVTLLDVQNSSFDGQGSHGIYISGATVDDALIENTTFTSNGNEGLHIKGGATVTNTMLENTTFDGNATGIAVNGGATDVEMTVANSTITNSTSHGVYVTSDGGGTLVFNDVDVTFNGIEGYKIAGATLDEFAINGGTINSNGGFGLAVQNASQIGLLSIDAARVSNHGTGSGLLFAGGSTIHNLSITRNDFVANAYEDIDLGLSWAGGLNVTGLATITNNFFNGDIGGAGYALYVESSATFANPVIAHENAFGSGMAIGNGSAATVDASGSWWGTTSETAVQGKSWGPVDFTPYLAVGTDADLGTPGFQGTFNELYVTALGQQVGGVGRIQQGVNLVNPGGTVNVNPGTYNESVSIDKPLNLLGANAGIDPNTGVRGPESIIDGTGLGNQNGLRLANVDGDVRVDGFTIQNAFNPAAQRAYQVVISGGTAGSTYLIQNNIINPVGGVAADAADYGVIAQGGDATIRVLNNAIGDAWWHGVMYERWLGETETAYNTFTISDPWATATLHMSYANGGGNGNVTTLQSVHDNIINNSGGSGIVLISGNPWGYNVGSGGVFSNVSIVNNTLTGIGGKGIQLEADSDTSGFQNVTIAGNTMSAAGSSSSTMRGIRLLGGPMNSNVVIENNTISGFDQGILQGGSFGQPVYANGTIITSNTLTDNGTGVQVDGGSMTLTANTITGSNPGLDLNGAADVDAYQNTITASQYGVAIDLADTASLDAEENVISGRVGVRSSSQGVIRLFNNDLSGYTQDAVVNWANNEIDASGNWWGTTDEAVIMDAIGGNESHGRYLVDFTPYLASNTDTDAAAGFQGDFSELYVTALGHQVGATGRIAEGLGLLTNSTLYINQGDYAEDVVVDRDANLVTIGAKGKSPVTAWSWTSHAGTTVGLDGFFASDVDASANSNGFAFNGSVLINGYTEIQEGPILFGATVDSAAGTHRKLYVKARGSDVTFAGPVGASTYVDGGTMQNQKLSSLVVTGAETLNIHDVYTTGSQRYNADTINLGSTWSAGSTIDVNGSLVLLSDSAISGNGITFDGTVNSDATGPKALAVTDSATTIFLGEVGGVNPLGSLSVNGGGTAIFHGDVTTRGGQLYANGVLVASSVTFADEASGDIQFNTLDGAYEVSVMTDGDVMFDGPVGDARSLGGLEVTSGGIIYLPYAFGGAVISTSDNGGYDGDVVFNSSTQLRSDTELDIAGNLDWRNETVYSAASGPYSLLIGAGGHVGLYDFSDSDADGTQSGMRVRELVVDAGGHIGLYGRMDIRDGVYMRSGGKIARMARRQRIIADELAMLADSGIGIRPNGRRQALRTQVGHLEAETQTGGIYIRNRGDVTLGNVGSYGREVHGVRTIDSGDIRIVSTGDLRLAGGPDMIMGAEDVVLRAGRNVQLGDDSDLALALAFGEMKIRAGRNVRLYSAGAIGLEGLTVNAGRNVRVRPGLDLPDLFMPLPPAAGLGTFGDLTVRAGNNILMGGSDGMAIAFAGGDMTFRALGDTLGIGTGVMIAGGDMTFQAPNGDIVIANTWPWLGENFGATVMYTGGLMTANAGRDIRIGDSEGVILANAVDGFDFDASRDVSINSSILLGGMDLAPIVIDAFLGQEPGPRSRGLDQRPAPGGNDGRPGPRLPDGLLFALVDSAFDNGLGVNSDAVFDITAQNNVNLVNDGLTLMVAAANDMNIAATDGDVVMVNDGLAQLLLTGMGDMNIQAGGDILGMNAGGLQGVGAILGDLNIRTMDGNIQLGDAGWGLGSYYVTGLGDVTMIGRNVNIDGQVFIGAGMLAMLEPGLVGPIGPIGPGNPPPPKPNDFQGPRDDEGPRPPFIGDGGGDVVIGGLDNVTMSAGRNGRPQVMAPAGQVTVATLNGDIAVEGVVGGSEGTTVWGFGAESDIRIGPGGYVYSDNGRTQIMAGRDLNVIGSVREDASIRGFTDIELWAGRNMTFDGSSVVAGTQRFGLAVNAQADLMAYAFNGQVRVLENPAGANEILTQGGDIAMIGQRGFVGNAPNSRIDSAGGSIVIAAGGEVLMNIPTYSRGGQILVAALGGDLSVRSTISSVGPGGQQGFFGGQVDPTVPAWQVAGPNGSQLVVIGDVSGWQANTKLGVGNIYLLELGGGNPFGNIGLDFLLAGIDPFGSLFDLDDRVKRYYFDNGNLVAPGTPLALPGGGLESLTAVNPWLESQAFRGATVQFYRGYTE